MPTLNFSRRPVGFQPVPSLCLPADFLQLQVLACFRLLNSYCCFLVRAQTVGDVLLLSQLELVETLDVPPGEAAALLRAASRSVLSAPVTVRGALCERTPRAQCISLRGIRGLNACRQMHGTSAGCRRAPQRGRRKWLIQPPLQLKTDVPGAAASAHAYSYKSIDQDRCNKPVLHRLSTKPDVTFKQALPS